MSTAAVSVSRDSRAPLPGTGRSLGWLVLVVSVAWLYGRTLAGLAVEWWRNPDYSHGLLVPFAIGYLVYEKRETFATIPVRPTWMGVVIIAGSQAINLVGFLGAEFFLQRFSFVLLIAGLILYVAGWRYLWESTFALMLLALAIPLPAVVFNIIALPLQLIASSWAESFLRVCQIPVLREGNILLLSQQTLNVTEACSGIRSLMSLVTLGIMLAYFLPVQWWVRMVFVLTTVPIAIVANSFRVAGTGLLASWFGEKAAQGFFHTFSGWLVFVFAFAVLLAELTFLHRFFGTGKKGAA
jgi:exosortase